MKVTEKQFLGTVRELARWNRWRVYHTHDSRRSEPGFPDLVLVRGTELIVAELKTDKGRVTPTQKEWLNAIHATGVETHVWRPADFDMIRDRLTSPGRIVA